MKDKILEYKTVSRKSHSELDKEVNLLIAKGWIPQGGMCVTNFDAFDPEYSQAMVLKMYDDNR